MGDARLSQTHQDLALRAELEHLVPLGAGLISNRVGHPDVAIAIDMEAVRQHEESGAKFAHLQHVLWVLWGMWVSSRPY